MPVHNYNILWYYINFLWSAEQCQCADGWGSADCSVDLTAPPKTNNVQGGGVCDRQNKECKLLRVTVDGCVDQTTCRVTREEVRNFKFQMCILIPLLVKVNISFFTMYNIPVNRAKHQIRNTSCLSKIWTVLLTYWRSEPSRHFVLF